jgi:amidophosphoribosyltransferase
MMREAGAKEVHMRIAAPPIKYPDYYGIDTPVKENLLAANHSLNEIKDFLDVDSIAYLSIDGLYRAMGHKDGRDPKNPVYTDHCFTGDYPTTLMDQSGEENIRQLSLLFETEKD